MLYILALPKWLGWIPIVALLVVVPFSFWVRGQVRKLNREEGPVGLEKSESTEDRM
jgi:hypothetical protein